MAEKQTKSVIDTMEDFFKKAPALPANVREVLVKITPWLALIFGILGILGGLGGVGLLTAFSPLAVFGGARGVASYGAGIIAAWVWLASSVLLLAAYPGTKAKKITGWNLLFWSEAVNVLGSLLSGSIVGAIIGGLIGFYLLFQIKSYYK
jgi:hypothetical protein